MAPMLADGTPNTEMLPYACGGVFAAGLVYVVMSAFIKAFGAKEGYAVFSASGNWSHHHLHRFDSGSYSDYQL